MRSSWIDSKRIQSFSRYLQFIFEENMAMKRKIKFSPQDAISAVVESIVAAHMGTLGITTDQAALIGASLGGAVQGFSLSDSGTADTILASLENAVTAVLESDSFELTDTCKELLKSDILSPSRIIEFMCRPDSKSALEDQILEICNRDPESDISTFPVNEVASEIVEQFRKEVLNNHELAAYASYCMLCGLTASTDIYLANQQYVDSFKEPLFLHKDSRVNMENLFVLQRYEILRNDDYYSEQQEDSENDQKDLQDILADFLMDTNKDVLFIEGDAGSGKTTLVAWMNYHYSLGDETAARLFGNRPLLTIRLRDLDKKCISEHADLSAAIRKYMNLPSLDKLEQMFPNAIMVLDGFDELCMIEGIGFQHEELLYNLHRKRLEGFQFIVTTRPKFISEGINIPSRHIFLQHFNSKQRDIWLDRYTSENYCGQAIDERVYAYIKSIDDDSSSCICDTPMTLYMLAAKKGAAEYLDNNWALYHHIFLEELSETEYNKMFPDPDRRYSHDIHILRDVLYQVSEEIAYQMYQNQNQNFNLTDRELSAIIERLSTQHDVLKHTKMKNITERCYALCCYWKANSDRGAVEFLHNNIRDFFLAEKIIREVDGLLEIIDVEKNIELRSMIIAKKLCSLFQYGILETKVSEFIFLRAMYYARKTKKNFALSEYQHGTITSVISCMSRSETFCDVLTGSPKLDPIQIITNILTCTVQLYRHIFEPYLSELECITWISEETSKKELIRSVFKSIFCQVPVTITSDYMITLGSHGCFSEMHLKSCDLRNIGFQGSKIVSTDFSDAVLCGCDFSGAILDYSDFSNADIHYASLENASLVGCNMTGADLRGTTLPDGFESGDQDEQVAHLRSLGIRDLKV